MDEIISAVRRRIEVADIGPRGAKGNKPFSPTSPEEIRTAESAIGFDLPPLLKRIFVEVANGGFGPGYGLCGVAGRGTDEGGNDIVGLFQGQASDHWRSSYPNWPPRILRIAYFGCAMHAAIDCSLPDYPVFLFDPNQEEEDIKFANCLIPFEKDLNSWLYGWALGDDAEIPPAYSDAY